MVNSSESSHRTAENGVEFTDPRFKKQKGYSSRVRSTGRRNDKHTTVSHTRLKRHSSTSGRLLKQTLNCLQLKRNDVYGSTKGIAKPRTAPSHSNRPEGRETRRPLPSPPLPPVTLPCPDWQSIIRKKITRGWPLAENIIQRRHHRVIEAPVCPALKRFRVENVGACRWVGLGWVWMGSANVQDDIPCSIFHIVRQEAGVTHNAVYGSDSKPQKRLLYFCNQLQATCPATAPLPTHPPRTELTSSAPSGVAFSI